MEAILMYMLPTNKDGVSKIGIFVVVFAIYTGVKWLTEHIILPNKIIKLIAWIGGVSFPMYLIENVVAGKMISFMHPILNNYMHWSVAFLICLNIVVLFEAVIGTFMKKIPILNHII